MALEDENPGTKEKIAAEEGADVEEEEEEEDEGNFLVQSVDIQSFNKIWVIYSSKQGFHLYLQQTHLFI